MSHAICDVTGAGDMVLAIAGLCLGSGQGWEAVAEVGNAAASLQVQRRGVAPVSRQEIFVELSRGDYERGQPAYER